MPRVVEGKLSAHGLKLALCVSRFNSLITDQLEKGALDAVVRSGGSLDAVTIYRVPGAFEVPLCAQRICEKGNVDAVVCLAAVIRGATPHFDYVTAGISNGIAQVQLATRIPVAYGVIAADTIEQAIERAGTKAGNKGFDAVMVAIEMATLLKAI